MSIDDEEEDPRDFRRDDGRAGRRDERGEGRRDTFSNDDKTDATRGDLRRDFREPIRGDPKDDIRRGDRDDRRDDYRSSREDTREKTRGALDRRDTGEKNLVTAYVPCAGIEEQVIIEDIETYLGPRAIVRPGWHPLDPRVEVYHMSGTYTLTQAMIEDLKLDSIRWKEEQRRKGWLITYKSSDTHRKRQEGGASRQLPRTIPASRPTENVERLGSEMSSSPRDRPQRDIRGGRDARDPREPRDPRDVRDLRDTRDSKDSKDTRDARDNTARRDNQAPEDEPRYMTKKDVELIVAQALKDQGKSNVSKVQFERLTAEYMERNITKGPKPKPGSGQPTKPIGRKSNQLDDDKDPAMFFR